MSTTDQPTIDAQAPVADRGAWAVPGVDMTPPRERGDADSEADALSPEGDAPAPGIDPGIDPGTDQETGSGADRDSAAAAQAAVAGWRGQLADAGAGAGGHVHPVILALATCLETLDGVREVGVATLTAREIRLMLLAVVQVITAAFALKLRLVVAGHTAQVAELTGATCTAAFLAHLTQTNRPEATSEVRLARDLDGRYRLLAAALARGAVGVEQVRACVTGLRRLPKDLPLEQVQACEEFLIDAARTMTPVQLKAVGRKLWEVIDPDGADAKDGQALDDEEALARAKAYFRSWRNGDGTTGFRGKLPDVQADMLLKLLHAHAAPRRRNNPKIPTSQPDNTTHPNASSSGTANCNGAPDETTAGTRIGQQAGEQPPHGDPAGEHPDHGQGDCSGQGDRRDGPGGVLDGKPDGPPGGGQTSGDWPPDRRGGRLGPSRGGCDGSAADACLDEESAEEEATGKTIPYPVRLGHALMDLLESIPATAIPDTAGTAASIVVTISTAQLATGLGVATLDTGTAISAGQARRLACAAGIIPMVLDGTSEPLDVGREQRLHTRYQRLAAAHRQQGRCGTEGCDRPITDYHHPHPWSTGGLTSLTNCLGLCGYHHHLAHHPTWTLAHDNNKWTFQRNKS